MKGAEKEVSIDESALRTYMEEQKEEAAVLSLSQQEHILSLMDTVKRVRSDQPHHLTNSAHLILSLLVKHYCCFLLTSE